jgi:hypothetical protein
LQFKKLLPKESHLLLVKHMDQTLSQRKMNASLGGPIRQSTSSLHDNDAFEIFEPSFQHYRKEATKIGPNLVLCIMHPSLR